MTMLQVRVFLSEPLCNASKHFVQMIPRLSQKYDFEVVTICKSADDYLTDEYFELDLPMAPGVMVEDEIVVEGQDVGEYQLESVICRHLGLPAPKIDMKALYELFYATLVWMNRCRKKWKARNLGIRFEVKQAS